MTAIICPMCDRGLEPNEGLVIRPINNDTSDVMRIIHVRYDKIMSGGRILHESDTYTYLEIAQW